MASTTDAYGNTTSNFYGDLAYPNAPTEVFDPLSQAVQYTAYDDFGNACVTGPLAPSLGTASQCAQLSGDTTNVFDAIGNKLTTTDQNGNVTTYQYGYQFLPNAVTGVTRPLSAFSNIFYEYAPNGEMTNEGTGGPGNVYRYDSDGRLTSVAPMSGGTTTYSYNGDFEKVSETTKNCTSGCTAFTATYGYTKGQLTTSTDGNAKSVNYLYNYSGQVMCTGYPVSSSTNCGTITSPATGSTTNTIVNRAYDAYGRLTGVTDWLGNSTTYSYSTSWEPYSPSSIAYPSSTGISDAIGYDNNGNVSSVAAGSTANDSWTRDSDERVVQTTINGSTSSAATYNSNDQVTAATNLGSSTNNDSYAIAPNGEVNSDTAPSGSTVSFGYNPADELCWTASSTSQLNNCPASVVNKAMTAYTYTSVGERASATSESLAPTGTITTYSAGGSRSNGNSQILNVSPRYVGDALVLSVGIKAAGIKVTSVSGGDATWQEMTGANDNPDAELWLGTVTTTGSSTILVAYSAPVGSVSIDLAYQEVTSGQGAATNWVLDQAGSVNSTSSSTTVSYPSLTPTGSGELYVGYAEATKTPSAGTTSGFTYGSVGPNDLYAYDASVSGTGAPTATQSPAGTYVAVAALLRATVITSPVVTNYTWNSLYELCNIFTTGTRTPCLDSPGSGALASPWYTIVPNNGTTYQYNGQGLRIGAESAVTVGSTTSTTTTDSTWDTVSGGTIPLNINDAVTTSANPGTTTNTSYIYGPLLFGGTAPVEQITGTTASFLVSNPTGVQGVFSSSGTLLEKAIYSTYGVQTIQSGADVSPFGFQGSYSDSTGLIYLVNRYYDPTTDQFLSIDPDVAQTDQPYVFTDDNPLNSEDPMGLKKCVGPGAPTEAQLIGCDNYTETGSTGDGDPTNSGSAQWSNLFTTFGAIFGMADPFEGGALFNDSSDATDYTLREDTSHIFRDAPGHFKEDTAENRALLEKTANNPKNYVGSKNGVSTYRMTLKNGKQVWADVRKGIITNGGINRVPR